MNIKEALKRYPSIEIDLLLSHILGKSKEFLYMNFAHELTRTQVDRLTRIAKRRLAGEPIAYILGYKDFYGLRFKVNKDVLIPRPETEWVVERALKTVIQSGAKNPLLSGNRKLRDPSAPPLTLAKNGVGRDDTLRILDIGTGSGCIVISLAKMSKIPIDMWASDVSSNALAVAKQNAKLHKVKIKFIKSDLLKNIKEDFDIIIANLPYGWHGVKNRFSSVKDGLKFEPQKALYTKEKGLFDIRRLLEQIAQKKNQPKLVYLEFDPRQKVDLQKLIKKHLPKASAKFHKDFSNFWRYAEIKT